MRKIGIFGGSFNPPHLGHLHLAETVHDALGLDEVLLIPARKPPHKSDKDYAPENHRLAMCRLFAQSHDWMKVEEFELHQKQVSYTYYTVNYLKEVYPEDELYLLIGSDMLLTFTEWHHWQAILKSVSLTCIARQDGEYQKLLACAENLRQFGKIFLVNTESFAVSSTKIRQMIQKNQNYSCYLPEKIVQYIIKENLYTGSDSDCIR